MLLRPAFAFLLVISCIAGCTRTAPPVLGEPFPVAMPSGPNVLGPRFASVADGPVVLSWMQRQENGATLRYSTLQLGEWLPARDVTTDPQMFVNWADLPSVTPLDTSHWVAHWLSKSAEATYAYDILLAQSADGGNTWDAPTRPHSDGTPTEHGFVSIHAQGDSASLLWLDGRQTSNAVTDDPRRTSMTLRSALVDPSGTVSNKQQVDAMVCDCCQTDVAISSDGPIAVYRNRTADEIRDISVSRFSDGAWEPGAAIADDGWEIAGCPVNGPAIDADGALVVIAWFSAAGDRPTVRAVMSTNAGRTFGQPVDIASRGSSGHVGVAVIDQASAVVSWVQSDNRGTHAINIRSLTARGLLGPVATIGRSNLSRIYPQLIRADDMLFVAWTDKISEVSEIVAVRIPIVGFWER